MHAGPNLELRRFETDPQQAGLEALLADPELARHLLVSFDRERGMAGNGARFRRNFAETWQRAGFGGLLLHERGEATPCGFVALKVGAPDPAQPAQAFEIYFGVARERWGRGLASAGVARFLALLERRFGPVPVRAAINQAQNPAGCRVLARAGFRFERWIALADFASPALARGSADFELWRVARRETTGEQLDQSAFRLGQLREAARFSRAELERALDAAIAGGGEGRSRSAARRALDAGEKEPRYALHLRVTGGAI